MPHLNQVSLESQRAVIPTRSIKNKREKVSEIESTLGWKRTTYRRIIPQTTRSQPVNEYLSSDGRKFHSKEAIKEFVDAPTYQHLQEEGLLRDHRKKGNRVKRYVIYYLPCLVKKYSVKLKKRLMPCLPWPHGSKMTLDPSNNFGLVPITLDGSNSFWLCPNHFGHV